MLVNVISVNLTQNELIFIRQALELVQIGGKDAKFLASLQVRMEDAITELETVEEAPSLPSKDK